MKWLDNLKNAFKPENVIFRQLKSVDDGMKFLIIKEILFQYFPKYHIHLSPRQKKVA